MRGTNVDGTAGLGGKVFAIVGQDANVPDASMEFNSYVDVLHRNKKHSGDSDSWYKVEKSAGDWECTNCDALVTRTSITNGDVQNTRWDTDGNWGFMFKGIPDTVIPPSVVREAYKDCIYPPSGNYSSSVADYDGSTINNDPSYCPYSTMPFIDMSGTIMEQQFIEQGMV